MNGTDLTPMPDDARHAEIVAALESLTACSSCGAMGAAPCALVHMGADLCPDCTAQAEAEVEAACGGEG